MKLTSLALAATLAVAGLAQAQTASQSSPPSSQAPAAPADSGKLDHACKKEIHGLCGRAHGTEMQDCIKSGLDMNKFSDSCKAQLKAKSAKSSPSSSKPGT